MASKPTWKTQFQLESFPVFHRRAWIEVFLKYNTGIPSSAAIKQCLLCWIRRDETKESDVVVRKL